MKKITYVAFGDSITDGYGVSRGFVSILSQKIRGALPASELVTLNTGMSGDSTRGGLYRLGRDVLEHAPDLVTINFGVNDAFSGISVEPFAENLFQMVGRIQGGGCHRIVLLSCEAIPEEWAELQVLPYWEAMEQVARETGAVYADAHGRWLEELGKGRSPEDLIITGDLHPNEEGHRVIAEAVWEAIQAAGLLEGLGESAAP